MRAILWAMFCGGLVVMASPFGALAVGNSLPDTIDRIRDGVVAVGTVSAGPGTTASRPALKLLGTGFVVGDGRQVITNLHVLPMELGRDSSVKLAVFTGRGESAQVSQADIIGSDAIHDLVLLQLRGKPLTALALADDSYVREGTEVAFTGFPIGMVLGLYPVTHRAIISAITPYVIPASSSAALSSTQLQRLRHPFDVYQLDAVAYPGNSGSPVYDPLTGQVLGVVNSVFVKESKESLLTQPSGITYVIPIKYAKNLIQVQNEK